MTQEPTLQDATWVLLPGTLCADAVFDPLLRSLGIAKDKRRAIALDAPHVQDYVPRLKASVTGGDIVCGFSLGALVAAHNLDALTAARAIVLLACNPFPDPPGNRQNREAMRDQVLDTGARHWVEENWSTMSTSKSADIRETVVAMAEGTVDLLSAQTELAASRPGAAQQLMACEIPLVFVTGSQDRLTPSQQIRPIVDTAKAAHLSIIDGLGHFALLEAPERVAQAVCDGLGAVSPRGRI